MYPTDIKVVTSKMTFYGWTILSSIIYAPSHVLFMSVFAPSRYESKLWDLKVQLDGLKKSPPSVQQQGASATRSQKTVDAADSTVAKTSFLYNEFMELRHEYADVTSSVFKKFLRRTMLKSRHDKTEANDEDRMQWRMHTIRSKLEHKYFDDMSSAVDWELFSVQPIRYMWNQSDTLFGVIAVVAGGLFKWGTLEHVAAE